MMRKWDRAAAPPGPVSCLGVTKQPSPDYAVTRAVGRQVAADLRTRVPPGEPVEHDVDGLRRVDASLPIGAHPHPVVGMDGTMLVDDDQRTPARVRLDPHLAVHADVHHPALAVQVDLRPAENVDLIELAMHVHFGVAKRPEASGVAVHVRDSLAREFERGVGGQPALAGLRLGAKDVLAPGNGREKHLLSVLSLSFAETATRPLARGFVVLSRFRSPLSTRSRMN
jgi:hypothetical protein